MERATAKSNAGVGVSKRKQILLIEDDVSLESIWYLVVKKLSFECDLEWVTSAAAAERLMWKKKSRNENYDIVLCDIFLSGSKTGIDFVHTFPNEPTEYIFTSGVCPTRLQKLLSREPRSYCVLRKPLDPAFCIETLNSVLARQEEKLKST